MNMWPVIDMTATGRNIVRLRKQAGLTVRDLQNAFGFSNPQAIYKWQREQALPTLDNLVVLAAVFGVTISDKNIGVGPPNQPRFSFFKHQTVSIQPEKGKALYGPGMAKASDRTETVKVLSLNGLMYLENNRVLVDALSDLYRKPSLTDSQRYPYYLDNFASLLNINQVTLDRKFGEAYQKLLDSIVGKNKLSYILLNEIIDRLAFVNKAESNKLKIIPFVRNKKISSERKNFNREDSGAESYNPQPGTARSVEDFK